MEVKEMNVLRLSRILTGLRLSIVLCCLVLVLAAVLLSQPPVAMSASYTWSLTGSGGWNNTANWNPSGTPSAIGDEAIFGNTITANSTITLDAARIVGSVQFDDDNNYLVSGSALTFDVSSGSASIVSSNTSGNGAHTIATNITLNDNVNVMHNSSGDLTLSGSIGGGGRTLTKSGAGTLYLSGGGANTYTGLTTVAGGVLCLHKTNATAIAGDLRIDGTVGGESIRVRLTGSGGNLIADTAAVTLVNGAGLNTLNKAETIGSLAGTGTIWMGASTGGGLTVGTNNASTAFAGSIQENGYLTKIGAGTLTLSGANTYTGPTTVNAGKLLLDHAATPSVLAATSALNLGGGTLELKGSSSGTSSQTLGDLTLNGAGGAIAIDPNGGAGTTLTLGSNLIRSPTATLAISLPSRATLEIGSLSADPPSFTNGVAGYATVNGTDFATRSGNRLVGYSGYSVLPLDGTASSWATYQQINGGATQLAANTTLNALRIDSTAGSNSLDLNGKTLGVTSGGVLATGSQAYEIKDTNANPGQLGATGNELIVHQFNTGGLTLSAPVKGTNMALVKAGPGTLILGNGGHSYTGDTRINSGTLRLGASDVIPDGAGKGNVAVYSALDLGGFNETINGLSGTGVIDNKSGTGTYTLTIGANDATSTFSGVIQNTSGKVSLAKTGTGTVTLDGAPSAYTGGTTVNQGKLRFNVVNYQHNLAPGPIMINAGATLEKTGPGTWFSLDTSRPVTVDGGTLSIGSASVARLTLKDNAYLVGALDFYPYAGYWLTYSGTQYGATMAGMYLNPAVTALALTVNDGAAVNDLTINGVTAGAAGLTLTKLGAGRLYLPNGNSYRGILSVDEGIVTLNNSGSLGAVNEGTVAKSGATLELQNGIAVGAESLTLNGVGVGGNGALRSISGNNTYGGAITLAGATRIQADAGRLTLSSATGLSTTPAGSPFDLTFAGDGNILVASPIQTGSGGVTKQGNGTLTLNATNTFSGPLTIEGGIVEVNSWTALGAGGAGNTLILKNNAVLRTTTPNLETASASYCLAVDPSGGTLDLTLGGMRYGSANTISGSGILTVTGGRTLQISANDGDQPYSGKLALVGSGTSLRLAYGASLTRAEVNLGTGTFMTIASNAGKVYSLGALSGSGNVTTDGGNPLQVGDDRTTPFEYSGNITAAITNLVKTGTSTWRLSGTGSSYNGATTIRNGVLLLGANASSGGVGPLGSATSAIAIGDAGTQTGDNLALRIDGAYTIGRNIVVGNYNSAGTTTLGGNTAAPSAFSGTVTLNGHDVLLAAVTGGTVQFDGGILAGTGTAGITKTETGRVVLGGTNTYAGSTRVSAGTLALSDSSSNNIASSPTISIDAGATLDVTGLTGANFALAAGQTLQGTGSVIGTIAGSGRVSPGNSPGVLTVTALDPSQGVDLAFEFARLGSPEFTNAGASGNDLLRLTDPSSPISGSLDGDNAIDVYFHVASVAVGDMFQGGFFTDRDSDFADLVSDATFNFYIYGDGNGSHQFEGANYYRVTEFSGGIPDLALSTTPITADFASGQVNGFVLQFGIVPEPSTLVLAAFAMAVLGWQGRRRSI
jgi:autotransporter-associated beta strand protein